MTNSNKNSDIRIALLVPAYQPLASLPALIDSLLMAGWEAPPILVINDGSDSEKQDIFTELSAKAGVSVISHAVNLGKGAALRTAFNHLLVKYPNLQGVITVDADGQHLPKDVVAVAKEFLSHPADLVLGARVFTKEVPLRSRFGNILTGHIFRLLIGTRLKDTQTGLRGIPADLMKKMLRVTSNRYEFELDMLINYSREHRPIREVPISTVYEGNNESSHFNPILDSFKIYFVFVRFASVSVATYAADLLVFTLVFGFTQRMLFSMVSGRLTGAVVGTLGSKFFVFKSNIPLFEVAIKFALLWLALLGISYSLMLLLVDVFHLNIYFSRILSDSILFVFNFAIQRDFIFGRRRRAHARAAGFMLEESAEEQG